MLEQFVDQPAKGDCQERKAGLDYLDSDKAKESRLQNVYVALPYKRAACKTAGFGLPCNQGGVLCWILKAPTNWA